MKNLVPSLTLGLLVGISGALAEETSPPPADLPPALPASEGLPTESGAWASESDAWSAGDPSRPLPIEGSTEHDWEMDRYAESLEVDLGVQITGDPWAVGFSSLQQLDEELRPFVDHDPDAMLLDTVRLVDGPPPGGSWLGLYTTDDRRGEIALVSDADLGILPGVASHEIGHSIWENPANRGWNRAVQASMTGFPGEIVSNYARTSPAEALAEITRVARGYPLPGDRAEIGFSPPTLELIGRKIPFGVHPDSLLFPWRRGPPPPR